MITRLLQIGILASLSSLATLASAQTNEGIRPPEPRTEIQASKLSKLPKQTKFVRAEYPKAAEEQGIQASVVLLLDINAEGKIDAVGIVEPAEAAGMGFDEAALVAAHQFEFEPAEIDGKPVAVQITYRYKFTLKPKTETPPAPPAPAQQAAAPTAPAAAQPIPGKGVINLRGVLRERGTRLPLAGVVITVFQDHGATPVGFEATSNESGAFEFVDLAPGDWKILAEPPGYYPFRTTELIRAREAVSVTCFIERGSYNPFDVTVTATRPKKEVSRTVLSAEEIEKIPGGVGDPLAVVQNFAGVARSPNPGQLVVRGSAPEDSRIFVDGVEVPLIYHFGGLRSVIPVGLLDSIEFYPGNFASSYGRATGGIVDVRLKQLKPKKVGGYADVSILDTGLFLEIPFGEKGGIALAGRRSYIDFVLNAAVPDNAGVSLVTAPRYYDFQVLANYRPSPAHDLRAFVFGSDDRLEILFENPADLDPALSSNQFSASTTFYRSLLTYRYVPNERFENTLRVSLGRDQVDFSVAQLAAKLDLYTGQLRDAARLVLDPHFAMTAGVDAVFSTTDMFLRFPRPGGEDFDLSSTITVRREGSTVASPALFYEAELKPGRGLLFLPGIRVDYFGSIDELRVQPRLTGRWQFADQYALKAGLGLFAQAPQFLEVDESFGNPELEAEQAIHYSAGLEYKPLEFITLDGTAFYKRLSNLVSPTDRLVTTEGVSRPLLYDNEGSGTVYGFELVARHDLQNGLSAWLAYTLSRATRIDETSPEERLFDFDQTHIVTLVASYALPRNWQLGTRWRVVSGNPSTPIVGAVYDASRDRYEPVTGAMNSDREGTFHQLDIRVDKRWVYESWMLTGYLDLQNVYNRENPEGLTYNFNFRESRVQQGLPLLPIIGLRGDF